MKTVRINVHFLRRGTQKESLLESPTDTPLVLEDKYIL